jgi:hypothetical protein
LHRHRRHHHGVAIILDLIIAIVTLTVVVVAGRGGVDVAVVEVVVVVGGGGVATMPWNHWNVALDASSVAAPYSAHIFKYQPKLSSTFHNCRNCSRCC